MFRFFSTKALILLAAPLFLATSSLAYAQPPGFALDIGNRNFHFGLQTGPSYGPSYGPYGVLPPYGYRPGCVERPVVVVPPPCIHDRLYHTPRPLVVVPPYRHHHHHPRYPIPY